MAPIVNSVEIARPPGDVFAYVTDPSHLPEWQESAVSARVEGQGPAGAGSRVVVTRRMGRREQPTLNELTELDPPRRWAVRGLDGPVRGNVEGTIEPLGDGDRSRVTIALDLEGHGIGKLLVPLLVRRRVQAEMPQNLERLKERLEA